MGRNATSSNRNQESIGGGSQITLHDAPVPTVAVEPSGTGQTACSEVAVELVQTKLTESERQAAVRT